ncbi:hypothetical protein EIN_171540 [Entamoeba invadens IP1]|uniref:Leucine rich repeat containing protein BspA family protein n=1 Tax=Entamoeba invadens IP1 TaxID=370355 RepID=A0A0A1TVQ8_ENTIV|nr:hypothetical protein EIN_171540 [Entamoeba invadens IP1]ELP84579.1 hypothetical protein EIN_171540 [Entamoeba invadens IP1]|eukprot:XP_004183925.1 hypothetical protein EIN_171540 [Entamoeba invadens IP1]
MSLPQLDIYSVQIVSNHFKTAEDYLNVICVCKKYQHLLDRFRYNPISVVSTRLFPYMETQHLYSESDKIFKKTKKTIAWYPIFFFKTMKSPNITFKNVILGQNDLKNKKVLKIPKNTTALGFKAMAMFHLADIDIPSRITRLANKCFFEMGQLQNVTISENVSTISDACFSGCSLLTNVVLPKNVVTIGESAFRLCSFQRISLPESILLIKPNAFAQNSALEDVVIPQNVVVIESGLFSYCHRLRRVVLPHTLKKISENAFRNCSRVSIIDVPSGVLFCAKYAFKHCSALQQMCLNQNCVVGEGAFSGCDFLTHLDIPNEDGMIKECKDPQEKAVLSKFYTVANNTIPRPYLKKLGRNSFDVEFDNSARGLLFQITKESLEGMNQGLSNVFVPETIESLGGRCFSSCSTNLSSIAISESVTTIGEGAFSGCSHIIVLCISRNVLEFPKEMCKNCEGLKTIDFSRNVYSVGECCFQNCCSLKELSFGDFCEIGMGCFEGCSSLTKLVIPSENSTIKYKVVYEEVPLLKKLGYTCTSAHVTFDKARNPEKLVYNMLMEFSGEISSTFCGTNFKFLSGVTKICSTFFHDQHNLKSIVFPSTLVEIGDKCLLNCDKLVRVTFPTSLTRFGDFVFEGCKNLVEINGITTWGGVVSDKERRVIELCGIKCSRILLDGDGLVQNKMVPPNTGAFRCYTENMELEDVLVPQGVVVICEVCFSQCYNLKRVSLSNTLEEIRARAFEHCYSLSVITIPDSVTFIGEKCFYSNLSLQQIKLPLALCNIGEEAFGMCTSLCSVTAPKRVLLSGKSIFYRCVSLKEVVCSGDSNHSAFDSNICAPRVAPFRYCQSLSQFDMPTNLLDHSLLMNSSFCGATSLETFVFSNSICHLPNNLFDGCVSLKIVILPDSLISIGAYTFHKCISLKEITIPRHVEYIGSKAFANCKSLEKVVLCNNIFEGSKNVFLGCDKITSFVIGGQNVECPYSVCFSVFVTFQKNNIKPSHVFITQDDLALVEKDIKKPNSQLVQDITDGNVEVDKNCFKLFNTKT